MTRPNVAPAGDLALIDAFTTSEEHLAPATRHTHQKIVVRFALAREPKGLLGATSDDIAEWLASAEPMAISTRAGLVGGLRAFYAWAAGEGLHAGPDPTALLSRRVGRLDTGDFGALMLDWRIAQERRGLADGTIYKRRPQLRLLYDWLGGTSILEATAADIERFLDSRNISPKSRFHYLSNFHAFYRWAVRSGLATVDPTEHIDRPQVRQGVPRPIRSDDLRFALDSATPMMRAWLCLAAYGGLRCREITGVHREDVLDHLEPALLVVRKPKGRTERMVPLHPTTWEALRAAGLPRSGLLFRHGLGLVYPSWKVSHEINGYLAAIGVEATAHQLRHWFGTSVYRATRDIRLTQEMLGHSSPTTTAVYAAFDPGDAVDVVRGLSA